MGSKWDPKKVNNCSLFRPYWPSGRPWTPTWPPGVPKDPPRTLQKAKIGSKTCFKASIFTHFRSISGSIPAWDHTLFLSSAPQQLCHRLLWAVFQSLYCHAFSLPCSSLFQAFSRDQQQARHKHAKLCYRAQSTKLQAQSNKARHGGGTARRATG